MSTANVYESLAARVYELDKPTGHSFGDIEFYAELLDGCTGPILETLQLHWIQISGGYALAARVVHLG